MDAVFFVYVISWRVLMLVSLNVTAVSVLSKDTFAELVILMPSINKIGAARIA